MRKPSRKLIQLLRAFVLKRGDIKEMAELEIKIAELQAEEDSINIIRFMNGSTIKFDKNNKIIARGVNV